jgi:hypothetical protein
MELCYLDQKKTKNNNNQKTPPKTDKDKNKRDEV